MRGIEGAIGCSAAALLIVAAPAMARERHVTVDAASGPWPAAANAKKMPYGVGDEKPPTIVPFDVAAGEVAVYATGTTDVPGKTGIGPGGIDGDAADDIEKKKKRYPSFYTPKVLYPANRHALVAVFVDAAGMPVSRPIMIGEGIRLPIMENAAGLALGFNDVTFAGNSGTLEVTVDVPD